MKKKSYFECKINLKCERHGVRLSTNKGQEFIAYNALENRDSMQALPSVYNALLARCKAYGVEIPSIDAFTRAMWAQVRYALDSLLQGVGYFEHGRTYSLRIPIDFAEGSMLCKLRLPRVEDRQAVLLRRQYDKILAR